MNWFFEFLGEVFWNLMLRVTWVFLGLLIAIVGFFAPVFLHDVFEKAGAFKDKD